ncbi:TPA: HEPN domain-containing protein [Serratia marcescens]|uniref:HEPN domain-containing protein n=1 Tax=Serratia marcescens TaxID=615 RepID=UPI0036FF8057
MGLVKSLLDDMQEERKEEWIREHLGLDEDSELDELSIEYGEAEFQFHEYQDHLADEAAYQFELEEEQEMEIEWLKKNPHLDIFKNYSSALEAVLSLNSIENNETLIKMQVAYSVTILESCLSEMLKSVVLSSDRYIRNAVSHVKGLNDTTVSLKEILDDGSIIEKRVMNFFSDILYHQIPKVLNIYEVVLQAKQPKENRLGELVKLIKLRHDIVHRDGKTIEGKRIPLTSNDVDNSVNLVRVFLTIVSGYISSAIITNEEKYEEDEKLKREDFLKSMPPF